MFFFNNGGVWSGRYVKELGIQKIIDDLAVQGYPSGWPMMVPDPENKFTMKAKATASCYKSRCPYYRGYWLSGGCGGVECAAAGEIIPGVVWDNLCAKEHTDCPFYKEMEGRLGIATGLWPSQ